MSKTILKQRLFRGHLYIGLIASWFLYISIFFGIFAIYLPYINTWEKPSRHFPTANITQIEYEKMFAHDLKDKNISSKKIVLTLPGFKGDPALKVKIDSMKPIYFNPITQQKIDNEKYNSNLAIFLNNMHYGKPLGHFGIIVYGMICVAILFLIIGGLAMIIKYKFNDNTKKLQNTFSKWHRKLFLWLSLPFFLIILCGSMIGFGFIGNSLTSYVITNGKTMNIKDVAGPVFFPGEKTIKKDNVSSTMLPVNILIQKAQKINTNIQFEKITLYNWYDTSAVIKLQGYNPYRPFLNGVTNKPFIMLNGNDGSLQKQQNVLDRPWTVLLVEGAYFLHLLLGVDIFSRTIVAIMMFLCGVAVVFSIMLYLNKKAKYFPLKIPFYHWFDKFSIFIIVGVIPATGMLFLSQWILPFDLEYRLVWQQGIFFNVWLATLAYSFYEIHSLKSIKILFRIGGILFIFSVISHWLYMGLHVKPINIFIVDIALLFFGTILILLSYKLNKKVSYA